MSCSGDSNSSLYRRDLRGRKEGSLFKVMKGVATFDYCKDWNIIGKVVSQTSTPKCGGVFTIQVGFHFGKLGLSSLKILLDL